jgi:prevent-host-death family protein
MRYIVFSLGAVMQIAIRELKATLSRVLSLAQGGEVIEVTSHRKPIARITGVPDSADTGLQALIASGAVTWAGGRPTFKPVPLRASEAKSVSDMVLEDRG